MADSVTRAILRILARSKGCSLDQLYDAVPYRWQNTDAIRPTHLLLPSLKKLMEWNLVEAYYEGETVGPDSFWEMDPTGWHKFSSIRFYVSPAAVAMEETLGLNLTGAHRPIFGAPKHGDAWPEVFVLMPFSAELDPLFEDHIKKVAAALHKTVGRADDFFTTGSIIEDIWSAIFHSSVVIADCTGRNPNVFYEIGIAHTLGRDTILLSQSIEDIPFDLRHLRVIVYTFTPRGMHEFEQSLAATLTTKKWL